MPAGLEQAREVVRWTEQVARDADHAKAKFYSQYQPGNRPAVVVTGANGLLGSAFVKRFIQEEEFVRLFVRQLPPPKSSIIRKLKSSWVILAIRRPLIDALEGATRGISHRRGHGRWLGSRPTKPPRSWVHEMWSMLASHSTSYRRWFTSARLSVIDWAGHPANEPVTRIRDTGTCPQQRGYYTQAKLEAERIVRAAAQERKVAGVVLRPGQIWSENEPADYSRRGHSRRQPARRHRRGLESLAIGACGRCRRSHRAGRPKADSP